MIDNFTKEISPKKISRLKHDGHRIRLVKYLAIIFIFFIGIKSILPTFQIRKFLLEDYQGKETIDITNALEKRRLYNLLTIDIKGLENEIKRIDPSIKTISTEKIFPDTFKVIIVHRKPIAQVTVDPKAVTELEMEINSVATPSAEATASGTAITSDFKNESFTIDNQGKMTDNNINSNLDKIVVRLKEDVLEKDNITTISDLIQSLHDINFNFLEVIIFNKDTFVVKYEIESYVLFARDKDIKKQVRSLQEMLERFTIEGIKPKKIDLRFEKALIVF